MRLLRNFVSLLILLAIAALAWVNQHETVLHGFFGFEWQAPLMAQLAAAFVLGALFALLLLSGHLIGSRMELHRLRKQLQRAQDELKEIHSPRYHSNRDLVTRDNADASLLVPPV